MALKLSDKTVLGEMAAAAEAAFTDPTFIITLVAMMAIYVGLWLTPDPSLITKVLAGALTVALLVEFAWKDIYGLAKAWSRLGKECAPAKTVEELKKAGDRFITTIGPIGFDIALSLVMWRVGKLAGPKVQKIGIERAKARATEAVTAAEAKPGSGKPPQATGETVRLLSDAKTSASDPTNPTTVLDALQSRLSSGARQGLKEMRSKAGDANTLKSLESRAGAGQNLNHYLTEQGLSTAQKAAVQAEILEAHGRLARVELIEIGAIKNPALRKQARADLVNRTLAKLSDAGILKSERVQRAAKNRDIKETIGALGEAIALEQARAQHPASQGYQTLSNLEIARELPHRTVAEWQAAEAKAGRQADTGKLRRKGKKLYESIAEVDVMTALRLARNKLRPVEVEQVKAGKADRGPQAASQNVKVRDGLQRVAAGESGVGVFEKAGKTTLGQELTPRLDLSRSTTIGEATRGPAGKKGFDRQLPYDAALLEAVAEGLVKPGGLPPAEPQPVRPLTSPRKEEEKP
jgi:hypothetical protein